MQMVLLKTNATVARIAAKVLRAQQVAIVIGKTIYLHNTRAEDFLQNKSWVLHELKHVEQYERYGLANFVLRYLWQTFRYGYKNTPLEIEARNAVQETELLNKYRIELIS
jgi:hypothetical protein